MPQQKPEFCFSSEGQRAESAIATGPAIPRSLQFFKPKTERLSSSGSVFTHT